MAFTSNENKLTKRNILEHLDSYQLFRAYCRDFKAIGAMFKSELRKDDKQPSCHIIPWEGDLLYKDFGESKGFRVFDYIGRKFNVGFYDTLRIINRDFDLGLGSETSEENDISVIVPEKHNFKIKDFEKQPTILAVQRRNWVDLDKRYWKQYEIPLLLLEYHNIYSIASYRIDSKHQDNVPYRINPYQIAYSMDYYFHEGAFRRKIYLPQAKGKGRFISNVNNTIVQGWSLLPKNGSDILFVTKSYKDILIFNLLGYWAIAPNSEHSFIPDHVMEKLKKRFSNIYVWFDNDEGGRKGAGEFAKKFELPFTHNPIDQPKDPSDYVKEYTLKEFDRLVTKFLKTGNHVDNHS